MKMVSLTMVRGKRAVFIGLFPRIERARTVEANLEWERSWRPVFRDVEVFFPEAVP
jgi:hypothetical protein